jgi:hypothetical protein
MENKTVNPRIAPLIYLYDIHTGLFPNVIVDITDKDAHNRLNTKANHIAWLAGSLVFQRAEIGNLFGADVKIQAHDLFKDYQGIKEDITYPSLESFKADWEKISPAVKDALSGATDEKLNSLFDMGTEKFPFYDLACFHIHRESYVIGQIGLWRRLLGYDAMKYPGM